MSRLCLPLCGAALLLAGAAAAQEQPRNIFPSRDVAVTYSVLDRAKDEGSIVTTHWKAGGEQVRVDLPGDNAVIVDRAADQAMLVMRRQHVVMQMPIAGSAIAEFIPSRAVTFTRDGGDTVAGYRCTVWRLRSERGTATVCLTEDGVVLRAQGRSNDGQSGGVLARSVSFQPQAPALFAPPADYPRVRLPALGGTALMAPNGPVLPR